MNKKGKKKGDNQRTKNKKRKGKKEKELIGKVKFL